MSKVRFTAALLVAHLNVRREKAGEEGGPVAADIKLTGLVKSADLQHLFTSDRSAAVLEGMYDAEGNIAAGDIETLKLRTGLKSVRAHLKPKGGEAVKFDGAELNQLKLTPQLGRTVEVSMRLQVNPTHKQVADLSDLLNIEVKASLEGMQAELDFDESEEEEETEEEGATA
jgi:hypothetical protein